MAEPEMVLLAENIPVRELPVSEEGRIKPQTFAGDRKTLLLKWLQFISADYLNEKRSFWTGSVVGLLLCIGGFCLFLRNAIFDGFLSDIGRAGLAFLLLFGGLLRGRMIE